LKSSKHFFAVFFSTFFFILFWQFNQFLLLLQSFSLLAVALLFPDASNNVIRVVVARSFAFCAVIVVHFFQPMMLTSISLCLDVVIVLCLYVFPPRKSFSCFLAVLRVICIVIISAAFNLALKLFFQVQSDTHVWSFVKAKFGLVHPSSLSFESGLYICHGAFGFLDVDFLTRTSKTGVLPLYGLGLCLILLSSFVAVFLKKAALSDYFNESALFLAVQSVLYGVMAVLTMRMKYVWFPFMAVIGAHSLCICDRFIGRYAKYTIAMALISGLMHIQYKEFLKQTANEQVRKDNFHNLLRL
jgi:hypothetical protein